MAAAAHASRALRFRAPMPLPKMPSYANGGEGNPILLAEAWNFQWIASDHLERDPGLRTRPLDRRHDLLHPGAGVALPAEQLRARVPDAVLRRGAHLIPSSLCLIGPDQGSYRRR